jgi:dolichol-phosphate mannosyltransferase
MDAQQQSTLAKAPADIPDISVIVPFFNEHDTIADCAYRLDEFCGSMEPLRIEVVFVDDGSRDDSVDRLKKVVPRHYASRLIKLSGNFGSHGALRAGILHAKGAWTTFVTADLQAPLETIERLYIKCKSDGNIVWAVREKRQAGVVERFFSGIYARFMKAYVMGNYPREGIESVMFDAKVRAMLTRAPETNSSLFLHILSLGFKQDFIPCQRRKRLAGASKWTLSKKMNLFIDSFFGFSNAPVRIVGIAGIILALIGLLLLLNISIRTLAFHLPLRGWPIVVSILLIGFGFNGISLGVIAEYVWRTLQAARNRPAFIVDEMESISKGKAP